MCDDPQPESVHHELAQDVPDVVCAVGNVRRLAVLCQAPAESVQRHDASPRHLLIVEHAVRDVLDQSQIFPRIDVQSSHEFGHGVGSRADGVRHQVAHH